MTTSKSDSVVAVGAFDKIESLGDRRRALQAFDRRS
jgi:hypothetical protein